MNQARGCFFTPRLERTEIIYHVERIKYLGKVQEHIERGMTSLQILMPSLSSKDKGRPRLPEIKLVGLVLLNETNEVSKIRINLLRMEIEHDFTEAAAAGRSWEGEIRTRARFTLSARACIP